MSGPKDCPGSTFFQSMVGRRAFRSLGAEFEKALKPNSVCMCPSSTLAMRERDCELELEHFILQGL